MKTDRYFTAITIILVLLLGVALRMNASALTAGGNPPAFETNLNSSFDFEEEAYVNDIPFSTECVSAMCKYNKALNESFEMSEESYINDIPFDTEELSSESEFKTAMQKEFDFEEETYIDDIPFETYSVTQAYFQSQFANSK